MLSLLKLIWSAIKRLFGFLGDHGDSIAKGAAVAGGAAAAAGALLLTAVGAFMVTRSGVLRRKDEA